MFDVVALCDDRGLWPPVVFGWVRRVRWAWVVLASMVVEHTLRARAACLERRDKPAWRRR